ncbi:MAG: hypothetical protein KCHDKBKB_00648 [Elusimicrobia bacterium]|nr:hypothetical protein [Elusimicrobiota bacterium]
MKASITLTKENTKNGYIIQTKVGGKWDKDMVRVAIERLVKEVDKKSPLVEWWELLWGGR